MRGVQSLTYKSFPAFLAARFCLTFAIQMQAVTISLEVYELSRDALALGLIGLSEAVPFMLIILPAGLWADVFRRKRLILGSTTLFVLCALLLWLFSAGFSLPGINKLTVLFILTGLTGIARGIAGPSIQATIPNLLPRNILPEGIAWNTSFWQIASIAGPAAGGMVYGFAGKETAYLISALCSLSALMLFTLLPNQAVQHVRKESIRESLLTGIRFVVHQKLILSALSLDMFAILFGGAVALLPLFNAEILHAGPDGLGYLRAAPSLGAVITALLMARNPPLVNSGKKLLLFVAAFGLTMIAFAFSRNYWLSLFLLILSGAFDGVSVLIRSTIIQLFTPDEMRGRVSSVNSIFIGSSNEIGAFESGVAARLMGLVPSVVFGGCMTLGITALMGWKSPSLRKLQLKNHIPHP